MAIVSVIIPAYNCERTIFDTVKSVLDQTFSDFELIIVNDGSTDSTLDVISRIEDPRIIILSHQNSGANFTRNRGLEYATGKYIAFLDSDDIWKVNKLELQVKALEDNPDVSLAYSWVDRIDQTGKLIRRGSRLNVSGNVYAYLLLSDFLENGSNPLIRKDALDTVGNFDESLRAAQDWDIYLRLSHHHQFIAVPTPQILYRESNNSLSSNHRVWESSCLEVIENAFKKAPKNLSYLKRYSISNIYKYLIFKSLEGYPEKHKSLIGLSALLKAFKYDPILMAKPVTYKVLLKIILIFIMPTTISSFLLEKSSLFDTSSILGYLYLTPDQVNNR